MVQFVYCKLNYELKVRLWWVQARERKKSACFVTFLLSEGNFFNICVLYLCIVYWMNFHDVYILLHIKQHYLFFKSSKVFGVSLIGNCNIFQKNRITDYLVLLQRTSSLEFLKTAFCEDAANLHPCKGAISVELHKKFNDIQKQPFADVLQNGWT